MDKVKRLERTLKEANTFLRHFDLTLLENLPYPELRSLLFSATRAYEGLEKIKKGVKQMPGKYGHLVQR